MRGLFNVQAEPLRDFVAAVVQGMGAPPPVAAEVACHLVRANLSGHDAHGVIRLPHYLAQAERGELVPSALPEVVHEHGATALVDAHRGFGHHATALALDWCVRQVRRHGIAAAAIRHASDVGRLGEYAERAAEAGLLAVLTAGVAGPEVGSVMLHGGRTRFFGPNPWAFAVPGGASRLVYDGSTSTIAEGEVRLAKAKGEPLPPDCVYDRFGRPSTDPDDFYAGGALVPLGGAVAGHKGYGLGFAAALFGGLSMIDDEAPWLPGAPLGEDGAQGRIGGVFLQVIDPGAFGGAGAYRDLVERTFAAARSQRPVAGRPEVLLPGEAEARSRAHRAQAGLLLPEATWTELTRVGRQFGVEAPPCERHA